MVLILLSFSFSLDPFPIVGCCAALEDNKNENISRTIIESEECKDLDLSNCDVVLKEWYEVSKQWDEQEFWHRGDSSLFDILFLGFSVLLIVSIFVLIYLKMKKRKK